MKTLLGWICILAYLSVGLSAIASLAGRIRWKGLESASDAQRKNFRKTMWVVAVIFTFVGIGSILQEAGGLDALRRWADTLR